MKAVVCSHARLSVADRPTPTPGPGQLLVEVERCGICGSDLHARHQSDELADVLQESGYDDFMRSDQQVVFGHEFSGGSPRTARRRASGRRRARAWSPYRYCAAAAGSTRSGCRRKRRAPMRKRSLVEESLALEVPNGLPPDVAALTEPMAVGWHAIRRGEVGKRTVAIVIGCGPVGLSVICLLKARGMRTIIASDPRRAAARSRGRAAPTSSSTPRRSRRTRRPRTTATSSPCPPPSTPRSAASRR